MNRSLITIRTVLLKDLRLLWPIILLCLALFVLQAALSPDSMSLRQMAGLLTGLASALLMLACVQTDAPAALSREWLTRPITPSALFTAKLLFLGATLLVPSFISQSVQALRLDLPLGEALFVASTGLTMTLIISAVLITIAALTKTLLEGAGALLAMGILLLVVIALPLGSTRSFQGILFTGSGWVATYTLGLLTAVACLPVLWLQYARRRTIVARSVLAALFVLVLAAPLAITWNFVFSVQKAVAGGAASDASPQVTAKVRCTPTGPATDIQVAGLPPEWIPLVGRVRLEQAGEGSGATSLAPANFGAAFTETAEQARTATYFWPGATGAAASNLHLSLNLLAPDRSVDIPLDGRLHEVRGIGSCRSRRDATGKLINLGCVIPGAQPAFVTAKLNTADSSPVSGRGPDYAPVFLRDATDNRYDFMLLASEAGARSAKLSLYEPRAHIDRTLDVDMPGAECPGGDYPAPAE